MFTGPGIRCLLLRQYFKYLAPFGEEFPRPWFRMKHLRVAGSAMDLLQAKTFRLCHAAGPVPGGGQPAYKQAPGQQGHEDTKAELNQATYYGDS